ncbi:MAG TPA: signal recognition particle receptor subunit alpha, partial [Aggregatilineales bacterium]|nr:signal recognition particle receptor subunit alpha [Aggregatilineales bacterium]
MLGNTEIDDEAWEDIEATLIQADVGVDATGRIIKELRSRGITKNENLQTQLREVMASLLKVPPTLNFSGREL